MMNIKQLEYFVEVAKTLNYTKAAQQLYISQSAITKQIQLLEDELGNQLFERNNKGVKLTLAGEIFLKDALSILYKIESTQNKMRDFKKGEEGHMSLGYVNGLERTALLERLHEFYHTHPKCQVTYDSGISYAMRKKLLNGQMDMIITHRYLDDSLYNNIEIMQFPMMVFVRKDSVYASRKYIEESECVSLDIICGNESVLKENIQSIGIDHALLQVMGNHGVAILPQFAIEYTQFRHYLVGIPIKDKVERIYAIYKRDNQNPLIEEMIKILKR